MNVITVDGIEYLGSINEKGDKILKSMKCDDGGIPGYVGAIKMKELVTLKLGNYQSWSSRELSDKEKTSLDVCEKAMKLAEKTAVDHIVCQRYIDLIKRGE